MDRRINHERGMKEFGGLADDLVLLFEVVEAGGYSAASARCGIPKSRLSRRIARLEQQLGVALITPGWAPPPAQLYAVYASRRTLTVAGRAFIGWGEGGSGRSGGGN